MAPSVVLVLLGEIGVRQYFNSLALLATTVGARYGGSDASHYLVGGWADRKKLTYLLPDLLKNKSPVTVLSLSDLLKNNSL
jgi:hypothetical protein